MIRFPTFTLEGKKLPRIIFSIRSANRAGSGDVLSLMKKAHANGAWCFNLPSKKDLQFFEELKQATADPGLMGLSHVEAEEGVSLFGKPLHRVEAKVVSTIKRTLPHAGFLPSLPAVPSSSDVLTQKEIDRIVFDPTRLDETLSLFNPKETPFLLVGGRYGDWLAALGRTDLLGKIIEKVRKKGIIPIYLGQWATFILPKAKPLDIAAFAIPINQKWSLFDHAQACSLIKKFDKPVISLNPLDDGNLLPEAEEAFSFLFNGLKIQAAIAEIASEEEIGIIIESLQKIPSLIPYRKT
jgi:hypothetical protein